MMVSKGSIEIILLWHFIDSLIILSSLFLFSIISSALNVPTKYKLLFILKSTSHRILTITSLHTFL